MKRGSPIDELLTVIFMILAIGAIVCYFAVSGFPLHYVLGGTAVLLRITQYVMRYFS
ncbi:MAG: hypothetical protein LBT35_03865 [Tannerella sp.]|jgi:hypothetical protein|nr:hypothetical protein [Tannerella sp.]